MALVLAFAGPARSGKDSACGVIKRAFQGQFERVAFADELKKDVDQMLDKLRAMGIKIDLSNDVDKEMCRDLLVSWGETARKFDPLVWVKRAEPAIRKSQERGIGVIVTDVRYANEVEALQSQWKAHVFCLERPGYGPANATEERTFGEIWEKFPEMRTDKKIVNDGTLELLGERVLQKILPLMERLR